MSLQSALSLNQCWPYRTTGKIWAATRPLAALLISMPVPAAASGAVCGRTVSKFFPFI